MSEPRSSLVRRRGSRRCCAAASRGRAAQDDAGRSSPARSPRCARSGAITIGYRESSIPFSYLSARGEPIGYSIDLCKLLVEAIGEAVGRDARDQVAAGDLRVAHRRGRLAARSTSSAARPPTTSSARSRSRFSPTIFVSGTKLLVKKGSPIQLVPRPRRQDGGRDRRHHQREDDARARGEVQDRHDACSVARDHAESFAQLHGGAGRRLRHRRRAALRPDRAEQGAGRVPSSSASSSPTTRTASCTARATRSSPRLVNDTFHELAEDGEIERRYKRWFLRKLPSGVSLDLPMSPQLETIVRSLKANSE